MQHHSRQRSPRPAFFDVSTASSTLHQTCGLQRYALRTGVARQGGLGSVQGKKILATDPSFELFA